MEQYYLPNPDQNLSEEEVRAIVSSMLTTSSSVLRLKNGQVVGVDDLFATNAQTFGGNGSDGDLTIQSGTTTLDINSANIFIKNYKSIRITETGKLAFSNPNSNGTTVILKSYGDVILDSSTANLIDCSALGSSGGTGGSGASHDNGNNGTDSDSILDSTLHGGTGGTKGTNGGGDGAGGATGAVFSPVTLYSKSENDVLYHRMLLVIPGSGGGGGGSGGQAGGTTRGTGGNGGKGGGALIIECRGKFTFTGSMTAAGANGSAGTAGSGFSGHGGGGGGGSGGMILVMYNQLEVDSGTYTVSGGTGGALGGTATDRDGGGGGGGSLLSTQGTAGTSGGAGGNGAAGVAVRMKNAIWQ